MLTGDAGRGRAEEPDSDGSSRFPGTVFRPRGQLPPSPGKGTVLPASKGNLRLSSGSASTRPLRYCPTGMAGQEALSPASTAAWPGGETEPAQPSSAAGKQPTPPRSLLPGPLGRARPPFGGGAARPDPAGRGPVPAEGAARPAPAPRTAPAARAAAPPRRRWAGLPPRVFLAAFSCLHPPRSSPPSPPAIFTREELGGTFLKLRGEASPAPPGRPQTFRGGARLWPPVRDSSAPAAASAGSFR